ncbi:V-type ATPase 116kDa subunit family protein [Flavobacterium celericrescens]|uniref:V-type ATPase 116kDa subunit family protein n=1 Tax=Flavobacterium celericrescens TaxID=2709780 RepID=A0ABX0IC23_9FLAO|nr:V-type ATPase 116kDa subunit family protein [Flavobacterium celericrescens]NHM04612.1 V-type ATPase 116kDa subunit family protein [Flavobacterium celericrescens]
MNGLSELIDSLEVKFFKLNQKLIQLEKKNSELQEELLVSKKTQQQQSGEIDSLKSQLDTLKMVNSLLGSEENKRETKLKINSLIREIDYCIAQLSD